MILLAWLLFILFLVWVLGRASVEKQPPDASKDIQFFPDEVGCDLAPKNSTVPQGEIDPRSRQGLRPTNVDHAGRERVVSSEPGLVGDSGTEPRRRVAPQTAPTQVDDDRRQPTQS
jgi:hypothetical protein